MAGANHPRLGAGVSFRQQHARVWQNRRPLRASVTPPAGTVVVAEIQLHPRARHLLHRRPTRRRMHAGELAAHSGLDTMDSAETNPKQRGLGKPWAGNPPPRFDEGERSATGDDDAARSILLLGETRAWQEGGAGTRLWGGRSKRERAGLGPARLLSKDALRAKNREVRRR